MNKSLRNIARTLIEFLPDKVELNVKRLSDYLLAEEVPDVTDVVTLKNEPTIQVMQFEDPKKNIGLR